MARNDANFEDLCKKVHEKNDADAFNAIKEAAAKNNNVFDSLFLTVAVNQNEEALKLIKEAAAEGSPEALRNLGNCYFCGYCGKPDKEQAVKYYLKASELGDATAQELLALSYLLGYGVERNLSEYKKWMKAAEKNGCIHAQHFSETYDSEDSFLEKSIKQEESEN